MRASCIDGGQRGFTMIELIVVMVLLAILGMTVLPNMQSAILSRDDSWRDGMLGALRLAQKTAVSHRRLVCVTVANTSVSLSIAAAHPATSCGQVLTGPTGAAAFATADNTAAVTTVSPSGVLYFQPDGRVTTDGAGTTSADRTISLTGALAITVVGETGHVD
jgi:MSHA pilin protein MshC